ncbi:hypothetical protein CG423_26645, partial [Shigella flexneri]
RQCHQSAHEPRQPDGCKLKTAPVRPVVAARSAEAFHPTACMGAAVCDNAINRRTNHGSLTAAN